MRAPMSRFRSQDRTDEPIRERAAIELEVAVHDHPVDAVRELMRFLKGGTVTDGGQVEDCDVGRPPLAALSAPTESELPCGLARHLVDRRLEGEQSLFPH